MNQASPNIHSVYYRLIALWVLCEAMLGGIIHGFKLPISGLFVGGAAAVIISLIGYYVPTRGAIIKATVIVAVFKMVLSPHSPLPAYIAVFFQGLLGELLFINKRWFKLSCLLLAVITLIESALQRILVLTILYGTTFWKAVDQFLSKLTGEKTITSYSFYFATGYIILHIVAGFFIGWFTGLLPNKIRLWKRDTVIISLPMETSNETAIPKEKRKKIKTGLLVVWLLLIALYIQSALPIGKPILSSNDMLQVFIRSVLIVLGWYLLVAPFASKLLQKWLKKKQSEEQATIKEVSHAMPSVKHVVQQSWLLSSSKKGLARFKFFCRILTVNIIYAA